MDREFKTKRLILRVAEMRDAEALAKAANDLDIARWLTRLPHPYDLDDARDFIKRNMSARSHHRLIFDEDGFVGVMGVGPDFGYWFAKKSWGQGYATEAGRAYLNQWFASGGKDLDSGYIIGNEASANVLAKLGFQPGSTAETDTPVAGQVTLQKMHMSAPDWLAACGMPIYTERLVLRPLVAQDWLDLQSIGSHQEIARNLCSVQFPWEEKDIKSWIKAARFQGKPGYRLGVSLPGGRLIGSVGLSGDEVPSVTYFISQQFQRRGFAQEALQGMLRHAVHRYGLTEIVADVFHDNSGSARILENSGFKEVGRDRATSPARVEAEEIILYRLSLAKSEGQAR